MSAQRVGGPVRFGGEGQRLQLLGVRRRVSTVAVGGVCVLGVRWSRRRRRGQRGGRRRRGVQGGGGAGLGQVCVRQVGDGVRLCQVGAGVCVRSLCELSVSVRRLLGRHTRSLQLRGEVLFRRNFRLSFTLSPLPLLLFTVVVSGRPPGVQLGVEESLFASQFVIFGLFLFGQRMPLCAENETPSHTQTCSTIPVGTSH